MKNNISGLQERRKKVGFQQCHALTKALSNGKKIYSWTVHTVYEVGESEASRSEAFSRKWRSIQNSRNRDR